MKVTWFGHAAFGLQPENGPKIIADPYTPESVGYAPIKETADLVIISSDVDSAHCRADLVGGDPEVVNALTVAQNGGRAQASGIEITAIEAAEWDHHPEHEVRGQNGMYRFTLDGSTAPIWATLETRSRMLNKAFLMAQMCFLHLRAAI